MVSILWDSSLRPCGLHTLGFLIEAMWLVDGVESVGLCLFTNKDVLQSIPERRSLWSAMLDQAPRRQSLWSAIARSGPCFMTCQGYQAHQSCVTVFKFASLENFQAANLV